MRTPVVPHIVTKVSKTMDRGKGTERKCSRVPKLGMYFYTAGTKMFLHSHPGTVFPEHGTQGRSRSPADYGSTLARATAASSFARRQRASLHQRADPSRCRSAGGSTCAPWHGIGNELVCQFAPVPMHADTGPRPWLFLLMQLWWLANILFFRSSSKLT